MKEEINKMAGEINEKDI